MYNFGNLILDLDNSARAKLYKNKQLVFIGDGYIALKMFLKDSEYHPEVMKKFKNQWVELMTRVYEEQGSWSTRKNYNGIVFKEIA